MATPDWAAAGERLLRTALQRAKAGDLPSLPVFEPEQAGSRTLMRPTGRSILLVAEGRRVELSPGGRDQAVTAVAISDTLRSLVRGEVRFMRTYREGPLGLIGRQKQSISGSEFQPRSPGSRQQRRFPIRMFSIGHHEVGPIETLRELFVHSEAARRHPDLAALAGFEVMSFYPSEPRYNDW